MEPDYVAPTRPTVAEATKPADAAPPAAPPDFAILSGDEEFVLPKYLFLHVDPIYPFTGIELGVAIGSKFSETETILCASFAEPIRSLASEVIAGVLSNDDTPITREAKASALGPKDLLPTPPWPPLTTRAMFEQDLVDALPVGYTSLVVRNTFISTLKAMPETKFVIANSSTYRINQLLGLGPFPVQKAAYVRVTPSTATDPNGAPKSIAMHDLILQVDVAIEFAVERILSVL